jgi:hypothetical protein
MSKLAKDLTVALREDRPGQIAKAAEALAKARINAEGLAEIEGLLHILTKKTEPAKKALSAVGFEVREQTVVVVSIENRPGRAAGIFRRIADAGLNVSFIYLAAGYSFVIGSPDPDKVAALLATRVKKGKK